MTASVQMIDERKGQELQLAVSSIVCPHCFHEDEKTLLSHLKNVLPFSKAQENLANNQDWEAHTTSVIDTLEHQRRVAGLALKLSYSLPNLNENDRSILFCAAMFHDVGKFELDPKLVFKAARLDESEYETVKTHASLSRKIIAKMPIDSLNMCIEEYNKTASRKLALLPDEPDMVQKVADLALEHQEHADGAGYPRGLKGTDISPLGRILVVADVFDALTNPRCYRENNKVYSKHEALEKIQNYAGIKFDDEAVGSLGKLLSKNQNPAAKPLVTPENRWAWSQPRRAPSFGAKKIGSFFAVFIPR